MRIIHLNHSDIKGGAARAAYRIHNALRAAGLDSRMWVNNATAGDWTVEGPSGKFDKALVEMIPRLTMPLIATLKTGNPVIHSPAIIPSQLLKRINASNADVVHLHWVAGEMLSIADIGRIEKPIVWTLHDMWAFCGAEHYTEDYRWRDGYRYNNRPGYEFGFDLNRWTWQRKCKHWRRPMHIVTPSRWLADSVRQSAMMRDWPVDLISYPIDIDRWRPVDKGIARALLGLPADVPLLLFGAMGGDRDPRKGFDLLAGALDHLRDKIPGLELVVFGQLCPRTTPDLGFPVHYTGHLHDDITLRVLYSASDAFALPSRQDNLPLTCMESLSCGTPVVAFDTSGPPSMIEHQRTGFLAKAFDIAEFAQGIQWVFKYRESHSLGKSAREYAEQNFDPNMIVEQYCHVYSKALGV